MAALTGAGLLASAPDADPRRSVNLQAIPDSILSRSRVVVLEIEPAHLADIMAYPTERGRHWERPARAAFLSDGQVTLETPIGVRIHGGVSRQYPQKSLRFYFRRSLGAVHPTGAGVGLTGDHRYETLTLHGDVRPDTGTLRFHYVNPIAYSIARRLGLMTANTAPASLVINGGAPQPYVITEHLTADYLRGRLGSQELAVYNPRHAASRKRLADVGPLAELQERHGPMANWTLEHVGDVVDVDNLSSWFMALLLCGTLDTRQGMLVRDSRRATAQWYSVVWDLDMSFGRRASRVSNAGDDFHLRSLLRPGGQFLDSRWNNADERVTLLRHLLSTSEPYRRRFISLFVAARDSLVTPAFIDTTLATYERAAAEHGVTDLRDRALIRAYLLHRPAALREQLNRYLGANLP